MRINVPNSVAPLEKSAAPAQFMHRLSFNGRRLLEGYLVPTHYDRLFSTCLRDYTTDYFVTEGRTDRSIIEAISTALAAQKRVHLIEFDRTMRKTNGRMNGFCGLSLIVVSVFELRKGEIATVKGAVLEAMTVIGSDLALPLTYLNKENVIQRGGTDTWGVELRFRCMPNLRGQAKV